MYIIKRAVGIREEFGGKYHPISITDIPLYQLFQDYLSVLVELVHTSDNKTYTLDMANLDNEIKAVPISFAQWLSVNQNVALPTTDGPLKISYKYLNFWDAWLYDFSIEKVNRAYHPTMDLPEDMLPDLLLTKEGADYWNIGKYCLYTVNGYIHRGDGNDSGVIIFNGAESAHIYGNNNVGLIDFQHLGEIETIPITEDMLHSRKDTTLREGVYIKLPKSIAGYTPMLVLGGFLHALDKSVTVVSDTVLKFDMLNYSLEARYDLMKKGINTESLADVTNVPGSIDVLRLWSDDFIKSLFLLPQSFIVFVHTDKLERDFLQLEQTGLPGVYYSYAKPNYPIILGNGRLAEYRKELQHGIYAINVDGYLLNNYVNVTTGFRAKPITSNQRLPYDPIRVATAKQLLIFKVVKE